MPYPSISARHCKQFALAAIGLCVFGFALLRRVQAQPPKTYLQTTWSVDIDFRHGASGLNETPIYTFAIVSPPSGGCPYPLPTAPSTDLTICPGDTVQWSVHTNQKKAHLRIFQGNRIFSDSNGKTKRLDANEGQPASGTTDSNVTPNTYEYCVAVFDPQENNHVYIDDPKIIVGGSLLNANRLVDQIEERAVKLGKLESMKRNPKALEDTNQLLKLIQDIKDQLHPK